MKKLALAAAVSAFVAPYSFAANTYTGTATSGTAADPLASFVVQQGGNPSSSMWYVSNSLDSASNKASPAIQMIIASDWTFDFTNLSAVAFTGSLEYGDYKTQTDIIFNSATHMDGRITYHGVKETVSGVGSYDDATHTFTYNFLNATRNGGGASTYSETTAPKCVNGATSTIGKVCTWFSAASRPWEGLALNLVFAEDKNSFAGTLIGTDVSNTALTGSTTTINWQVAAQSPVPVPAAAWLFGSGLVGLAGASRRRSKKA